MWLLAALLAGVLTAGLSSEEQARRRRKLNEALRQRLGLEPDGSTPRRMGEPTIRYLPRSYGKRTPVGGGVPVWVWPDGDRILRIVTQPQVDEVLEQFDDEVDPDVLRWGVRPDANQSFAWPELPGIAIFVYVDAYNRLSALLAVEDGEMRNFSGFGDGGCNIYNNTVRSRMFQFIQDYGLTQALLEDPDMIRTLWYDNALVEPGMAELKQAIVHQDEGPLNTLKATLSKERQRNIHDYYLAYEDLYVAYRLKAALQKDLDKARDPELIADLRHEIELVDLRTAVKMEVDIFNETMLGPSHVVEIRGDLRYMLETESRSNHYRLGWKEDIVSASVDFSGELPVWIVDGHRQDEIGMGLAMGRWLETQLQLYNKAPEDTIWTWPGEELVGDMEARFLLGEEDFDPVAKDLPEFLEISYRLGLLTPDVIDYWSALLLKKED